MRYPVCEEMVDNLISFSQSKGWILGGEVLEVSGTPIHPEIVRVRNTVAGNWASKISLGCDVEMARSLVLPGILPFVQHGYEVAWVPTQDSSILLIDDRNDLLQPSTVMMDSPAASDEKLWSARDCLVYSLGPEYYRSSFNVEVFEGTEDGAENTVLVFPLESRGDAELFMREILANTVAIRGFILLDLSLIEDCCTRGWALEIFLSKGWQISQRFDP